MRQVGHGHGLQPRREGHRFADRIDDPAPRADRAFGVAPVREPVASGATGRPRNARTPKRAHRLTAMPLRQPAPAPAPATVSRDVWWLAAGLALLVAWEASGLDIVVTRHLGTPQGFAWREHWLTAGVIHQGLRAVGWGVFAALVVGIWRPWAFMATLAQRERVAWVATTLLCVALIPLLKRASATSCPWSLAEFGGGAAVYVPHWVLGRVDGGSGRCFPSGHASTAFAFLAGWFALRRSAPRAAQWWLAATLAVGLVVGWGQTVRGAHYVSHTL